INTLDFKPFTSYKHKNTKIRVGFISPDFKKHPISILTKQQWTFFDRQKFTIYGYYTDQIFDDYTKMIASSTDVFRHVADMDNYNIAKQIHNDCIDILIDLSGYTKNSALSILAYRPAKVQCHGFGFMGSLQSPYIDYYLSDK